MYLQRLELTNFKNYERESLSCGTGIHLLTGLNGMGKTNLLEAIYYLCMCKSYFNLPDTQVVRKEQTFFRLEGHFQLEGRIEKIVAKVEPRKRKTFERNEVAYERLYEHIGQIRVVFIVPDDTLLVTGGSEDRRRFLDNALCQLDHRYLTELLQYNKILRQRNAWLKQFTPGTDSEVLKVYDQQLSGPAAYLFEKRRAFVLELSNYLYPIHRKITAEAEKVELEYRSSLSESPLDVQLVEAREKDLLLQRTTAGPHRDDLRFRLEGELLKRFASQGQLKSFVLALKLAQYRLLHAQHQRTPLLLLDDLFDKLDPRRVEQLLELISSEHYGQVFITDTQEARLAPILSELEGGFRIFSVDNGKLNLTENSR